MYFDLGANTTAAFCSERVNAGAHDCKPIPGVCLPLDSATLAAFKSVQRTTNAILAKLGKPLIDVDGRIGMGTVRAVNAALPAGYQNCEALAVTPAMLLNHLIARQTALGAPPVPDPKPKTAPSMPTTGGGVVHPPPDEIARGAGGSVVDQVFAAVKSPIGIAAAGIGAVLLITTLRKPARARRRRR